MTLPFIHLASSSPRRKQLVEGLGFNYDIVPSLFEEIIPESMGIEKVAEYLAKQKGMEVLNRIQLNGIILAADTIVVFNNQIKGKPQNLDEAKETLLSMSGKNHEVITGVCLLSSTHEDCFSVVSKVYLDSLSEPEIDYYFSQAEVLDKAGSYGIQDWIGLAKIRRIEGSYTNIMGLPSAEVYERIIVMNDLLEK